MSTKHISVYWYFIFTITLMFSYSVVGQQNKSQTENLELYSEIAHMDSVLFSAFNNHDAEKMSILFTNDLEFYHDKNGLSGYEQTVEAFRRLFSQNSEMRRELDKGSMEVYPINNYGAVEIGVHTFYHMENGERIEGTFKFIHLWKKENGQWKISRIISYDH